MTKILLETVFGVSWAIYLGGALIMSLVWKPVQKYLPPGQTAIVCETMGRKYKWIGLGSLSLFALSWLGLGFQSLLVSKSGLDYSNFTVLLGAVAVILWMALVYLVLSMGLKIHPSSHVRISAVLDSEKRDEIKLARKAAIKKMDLMLKVELMVALLLSFVIALGQVVKI